MKRLLFLLFFGLCVAHSSKAQVKIGANPQNIDAASVLELESTDKVLVITRVTTTQMNAIVPLQGAMVYNIDLQSVHFFDGTQWVNIGSGGGGTGGSLSADPIVNDVSTIVITPTATGDNLEVAQNSIGTLQIANGGVNGTDDILDNSIGPDKIQDLSVTQEKLSENSVGAFALDNDNIGVSAFNNDVGYITSANIVSTDAGNALQIGTDNGAFYDEAPLINAIQDNSDAIALDNDQSPSNEIQNISLNGSEIMLTNTVSSIDIGPLIAASATTTVINSTPTVTVNGTGTTGDPYELTAVGGTGGGTTEVADQITITGIGIIGDPFKIEPSATVNQVLTTTAAGTEWADLPPSGGSALFDVTTISGTGVAGDEYTVADDAISTIKIQDANVTPIKIEPSATVNQVLTTTAAGTEWADLPPSGASALFDVTTISGTGVAGDEYTVADDAVSTIKIQDANVTPIKIEPSATVNQVLTTTVAGTEWADLPPSGASALFDVTTISGTGVAGDEYTVADDAISTIKIQDANVTPIKIEPSATVNQVLTTTAAGTEWADLPPSGASALFNVTTISGTGVAGDEYTVADDGITSVKIENATILAEDLSDMGATADGEILQWNTALGPSGGWEVAANSGHVGNNANNIFFAGPGGVPIDTEDTPSASDNGGLIWDPTKRFDSGALYLGYKANGNSGGTSVFGDHSKLAVAERLPGDLAFPIQVVNEFNGAFGTGTGILFAVDAAGNPGGGGLVFERVGPQGQGDFHFLASAAGVTVLPTLADKVFTVENNGDVVLTGNIIGKNGAGALGQVLTTTAGGTEWAAPSGGGLNISSDTPNSITTGTDGGILYADGDTDDTNEIELPTGGANGNVLSTDGAGTYNWIANTVGLGISTDIPNSITTGTDGGILYADGDTDDTNEIELPAGGANGNVLSTDGAGTYNWIANTAGLGISTDIPNSITTGTDGGILYADGDTDDTNEIELPAGGANGNVLSTDGAGTYNWIANTGGAVTTDVTISGDGSATPLSIAQVQGSFGGTSVIVPNSIGTADIGANAIQSSELDAQSVGTSELKDGEVTTIKIAPGADGEVLTTTAGVVAWGTVTGGAVTTDNITIQGNGTTTPLFVPTDGIDTAQILDEAITSAKIAQNAVTQFELNNNAVATANIIDFTILDIDVANGAAIAGTKINPNFGGQDVQTSGVFISGTTTYPDYVFQHYFNGESSLDPDYKLASLNEVSNFIKLNHHLPGVKSASEIQKNNNQWNLSEGALTNLEKIEELFIHTIEQEHKIKKLASDNQALSDELKSLQKDLQEIKALLQHK